MRTGGRIGAGVVVLGLVLSTTQAANADPPAEKPRSSTSTTVTLVTGDQVTMHDDMVVSIRPGEGREQVTFSQFNSGEHLYVMPNDARQLVTTGQLDRRLFDLTTLVEFGYDDAHRDTVPLIVTHPKGKAPRVAGAAVSRELPSINAVALTADKSPAAWEALTDGGALRTAAAGVSKIWLDGKRQSTLDYSVPQIGAPAAWAAGFTGAGVKVAVLDTGVDQTHPDLAGQEIAEQNFSWSPDNVDNRGHGTHVASILAGTGAKYRGVAPGASILDGKVLDDFGGGSESGIVAGMEWAAQQGADIANMSLAGMNTPEIDPVEQAVETLTAQYGTLFVVAAGNRNVFLSEITSPGSAPSALTVGAVDRNDALADFSLTGPTVGDNAIKPDVTAPGVGIVAARHSAGTIGTPVEDGYTALSGTSMATPHVAGAAALIAQQHPDWTGQQLKAALTGSAKPTQGLTEFQQGAGRVDVTRALHQTVVAEPANINLGTVAWPHDDDEPVAKPVTYRNFGDADVTLDLTVAGPVFSLSTNQITVPAGGTASVNVIGDAKAAPADDVYSATVVATAGDSVTRTPVAITRETEKYNLTLNYVDEHGQPTSRYSPTVTSLEDASETIPYDADGSVTVRLPKGRYVIDSVVYTGPDEHANMIVQPGVNLDRDQTFTIDPTIAKPISITLPTTAELGLAIVGYLVETEDDQASGGIWASDLSNVSTAQLGEPLPGTETSNWVSSDWRSEAEERFELVWLLDRYPTGYTKAVRWRELATVRMELGAGAEGDKGVPMLIGQSLSNPDVQVGSGPEVDIPITHVAYVTTEGVQWRTEVWLVVDHDSVADLKGPWRNYRAGRTYREQYNRPMYGPGLPSGNSPWGLPWAWRKDDRIAMNIPLFTDSAGNAGFTWAESSSTKLYLDDQLVDEWPSPGSGDFRDLPAAQGNYRLTTEAVNPERFAPTAAVSVEWTFRSGQVDAVTALDLNVVRFHPKLTADGSAPAGKPFQIPVEVQDETGATVRPNNLTVEASYDGGKTWQRVQLTSNQVAKLNHPAGATSVSLRACATDRDGYTVKQTIISAYTLR